ncbi:ABC transporter family substrate-binding protein [Microbacterium paludicola]|uniref:ABC transporter family substrate-binding protein n=1 Tax=Microbacterium paludicola TaxID=300019 RepID=A0A4Y9FZM2_9MICO|nr:ABC transporter family substrate-binding protein [Microbacterium paludicola]MBF0815490.1 ABC transporter family substrate-binding protein [Microbacterium paludicola]TFU34022.1 ABC transporter family substrate-binding protein [Microbacterium paludicola]
MKLQHKLLGVVATGGALALTLAGCAGGGNGNGNDGAGEEAPQTIEGADYNPQPRENLEQGGEVVFPISEITPQMNVNHSDGSVDTATIWEWYNPQTILMSPEGEASANPNYLTGWEAEEVDGKTVVTFTINPEAKFNDGTPFTWESYKVTWEANRSSEEGYLPNSTDGYSLIESVEQGDDEYQAVVTFSQVYPWWQGLFWHPLHPAVNSPELFNEGYLEEPNADWGAGPYKIEEFDKNGGTISFVPNENWWGDEPLLDKVTFRVLEPVAAVNAFQNGETNYVDNLSADNLEQLKDVEGAVTYRAQRTATNLLQINAEREQFADLEVREAMFKAIDREQIKEVVWDGLGYTEEPVGSLNLFPFQEGYVDALSEAGYEFNVEDANAILDEAGWTLNGDVREKDGVQLAGRLPIFGDDPITQARAQVIQSQLAEIGVQVEIDVRPASDFSTVLTTKDWDLVLLGFSSSDPYGVAYMCQLYCSDSGLNLSATGTPEIDERIKNEVSALPTAEEQTEAGLALEAEIIAETWGILPLYMGPWISMASEGLANLTPETYTGLDLFGLSPVENVGWEKGAAE